MYFYTIYVRLDRIDEWWPMIHSTSHTSFATSMPWPQLEFSPGLIIQYSPSWSYASRNLEYSWSLPSMDVTWNDTGRAFHGSMPLLMKCFYKCVKKVFLLLIAWLSGNLLYIRYVALVGSSGSSSCTSIKSSTVDLRFHGCHTKLTLPSVNMCSSLVTCTRFYLVFRICLTSNELLPFST